MGKGQFGVNVAGHCKVLGYGALCKKRLNQSTCSFRLRLGWATEPCITWGADPLGGRAILGGYPGHS